MSVSSEGRIANLPTLADVRTAAARLAGRARVTPILRSEVLDAAAGARLHFKCEHLQHSGAFKFRGACNAVWSLDEAHAARGVVTHSSGNHGQALALAAASRGLPAHVVVPEGAVRAKVEAIEAAGARIYRCAPTQAAREAEAARVADATGATLVHPYTDSRVIAGQGTVALELLQAVPSLDTLLVPVGGGGLAAGCALVGRGIAPNLALLAAEPAGADDAARSLRAGRRIADVVPETVCDGLRATVGTPNFDILKACGVAVLTVTDAQVLAAMRLLWRELRQVVEPSSATVLAAIQAHPEVFAGREVGVVLTGGNVDLDALPFG
ncbi:pyridoxal-phosphate dependent enzyme [Oleiagrimonas sp. MCCC 1A03011]|uniref:pyridoxal-phosphate dependent enzyme n=1 Tax=Oleiagrimonas sp. MCCC 1A03011 TaxID=1926883 RepID=UPI000DC48ABD|nr:pyridoxal-phosphate dependent enzyme [Oleiagrimonas sp. MCCC 1A03011]RAP56216.1 serine dehydratase [Oleiagrimonas sp. MCCC 1A03011]